jgi:hypothetical protein
MEGMHHATHLPTAGEVFVDDRGDARTLRVSWHTEAGVVVLSLWRGGTCAGTFRLGVQDVPAMIALLSQGLDAAYDDARLSFLDDLGSAGEVAG